ncbi:hypothetical protein [Pediococcus argentinicus]|nr:hypothetical protein [Pediococcus argentinicus]NKZ22776.1 peptidoglycan-binding protein [Pediococcus argentinicus]GEP19821.1 hypothetical protein LSA03_12050 [Pediococcus argentinicus]
MKIKVAAMTFLAVVTFGTSTITGVSEAVVSANAVKTVKPTKKVTKAKKVVKKAPKKAVKKTIKKVTKKISKKAPKKVVKKAPKKAVKKTIKKVVKKAKRPGRYESKAVVSMSAMRSMGVKYYGGKKWTYFKGSRFADGSYNYGGYDKDGYLIVAAPRAYKFGSKVKTPLGMGKVHDRGTAIYGNHFDVVIAY